MSRMYEIAFNIMARMGSNFNSSFSSASDRMTQLNTRVTGLKAEMKELDAQHKKNALSALEYSASYEKLTAQMYKAEQRQKSFAKAYALQNKVNQSRSNARMNMVGAVETAAAVGGPVYASMNFETAMSGVAKQVDGARDDAGKLTDVYYQAQSQVMQASKDMMILPDNMAKAFAMSAKSGVQGMQNIDKFARMGIMMGTAFEVPAEQVTEDFAKIGSAMGISLQTAEGIAQLEALADTVNYLDDRSNAAGADIIQVLKRTSGTATSLLPTLSRTTLAGMSTAMLQMGETGETAGTALNALFTKIAAAPTQAKSFQGALAQLGLTAEELQSGALTDAEGSIMNLFERIRGLDAASKNNVLAELFGAEHIDNLSKISGNYDEFLRVIKMGNSDAAKGSMLKEFEIQSQNTERKLEGLKATAARTAITFGSVLLPDIQMLSGVLSDAGEWVAKLSREHDQLSGVAVRLAAAVLGGTVAFSAMAWVGWAVIAPFVSLYTWSKNIELGMKLAAARTWLFNSALYANPALWAVAGIAALVAGGYLLYKNWDLISQKSSETWGMVKTWFSNTYDAGIKFVAELPASIAYGIGYAIGYLATLPDRATTYAMDTAAALADWTSSGVNSASQYIANLPENAALSLNTFLTNINTWGSSVYDSVASWFNRIPDAVSGSIDRAGGYVQGLIDKVKGSFNSGYQVSNGPKIAQNANGGIYGKGAFLTTFAEKSPEAAIPLDGSRRAMSLWAAAGDIMGIRSPFEEYAGGTTTSDNQGGSVTFMFNPSIYLNGGDPDVEKKLRQVIHDEKDDFENQMSAFMDQQRRLAYA